MMMRSTRICNSIQLLLMLAFVQQKYREKKEEILIRNKSSCGI